MAAGLVVILAGCGGEESAESESALDMVAVERDLAATPGLTGDSVPGVAPGDLADGPAHGWADSVPLPPWVSGPGSGVSRQYRRIGEGAGEDRPTASAGRVQIGAPPLVAVRLQGRSVAVVDASLGTEPVTESGLGVSGPYRITDDCRAGVALADPRTVEGRLRARGTLDRAGGGWLFALVAGASSCDGVRRLGYPRTHPDRAMRDRLAQALSGPDVVPGGIVFEGRDVREYAESPIGTDGGRYVWAVLRQPEGTQIAPPPAIDQAAMVARVAKDGSVTVVWVESLVASSARLGLVAAWDVDRDRRADGLFGVREGERVALLAVGPDSLGTWRVFRRQDLGYPGR